MQRVELRLGRREAGTVLACCPPSAEPLAAALCRMATATLGQIEQEARNEELQKKLVANQESLLIVADVASRLATDRGEGELLQRLLGLATGHRNDVRAVLWIARDGQLYPTASKNAPALEARPASGGLLGTVVATAKGVLTPGPSHPSPVPAPEPELCGAAGMALLPLQARSKVLGALEVWSEQGPLDGLVGDRLETIAFLAATVLENDHRRRRSLESERLRRDVEIAGRIQQALLFGTPPVDVRRATASALTTPSLQIGGDFYDFFAYDKALDVLIGDVMGKGVTAALVGAAAKVHFLRAANYLFAAHPGRLPEPREILTVVSDEMFHQLAKIECFVTLCYARFDLAREQVHFIDCGHPSTIHVHGRHGGHNLLRGENMPLGFSKGEVYRQCSVPFESGDVFLFYSDGLTEARHPTGEYFGVERLARRAESYARFSPRELVKKVQHEIRRFTGTEVLADDLTCVAVKIADIMATVASTQATLEVASRKDELARVRAFLRELCERQIDPAAVEAELGDLEAAAAEVVGAIITHSYFGREEGKIRLEAELFVNRFVVRVYHGGSLVDPDVTGTVSAGAGGLGGLGVARSRVDVLRCSRGTHGESCVYLEKSLGRRPGKGG
jgi:sigma-B regulation protein RsbU (phosphoserine phosphatase)